jgi:hypothetical protein
MKCFRTPLSIAMLACVCATASAAQPPAMWTVQVTAQTHSGPQEFALTIPDDGCQSQEIRTDKGPQAVLKVCMGNGLSAHVAYGWLVTDPDMAALDGDRKYDHAQRFTVGTDGAATNIETSLYSVKLSRSI